jgi:Tfp pilus assembly PilM family ATPase
MTSFLQSAIHRRSLIGVDSGGRFLKAVQLVRTSGGGRMVAAVRLPKSTPGAVTCRADVDLFCGAMARQGFTGSRVVLAVPQDKIVTGILELPPRASGAPLADIARLELASMNNYDAQQAETVSWDLPPSPRVKNVTQAMAVACRHADAEELIELFESAGLQVAALDSPMHAVVRACRPLLSATGITGILELEWDWAVLVLLYRGTVIYRWSMSEASVRNLVRTMAAGLSIDESVAAPLLMEVGLAPQESRNAAVGDAVAVSIRKHLDAVAESIGSPILYAGQQYPAASVDSILMVGSGAAIPGAADYLQTRVAGSVKAIGPADLVACAAPLAGPTSVSETGAAARAGGKAHDPSLVSAIGLARFEE